MFEVLVDKSEVLGRAVGKVRNKYGISNDGMYLDVHYFGTDNQYSRMRGRLLGYRSRPLIICASVTLLNVRKIWVGCGPYLQVGPTLAGDCL